MTETKELAVLNPQELMRQSTDVAGACREIVTKTAVSIQNRKYVRVEGWSSIAIAHGCVLSARDVEKVDGGIRAIGEVRRMSDGAIVSTAEGFVGDDEATWAGRAEYARRAMAQTRAMSRAARTAFAHVVTMMDAGLSTTPAEEVPDEGFSDHAPRAVQKANDQKPGGSPQNSGTVFFTIKDTTGYINTDQQAPNEFWDHWKTDQAKAAELIGGIQNRVHKIGNAWFIFEPQIHRQT